MSTATGPIVSISSKVADLIIAQETTNENLTEVLARLRLPEFRDNNILALSETEQGAPLLADLRQSIDVGPKFSRDAKETLTLFASAADYMITRALAPDAAPAMVHAGCAAIERLVLTAENAPPDTPYIPIERNDSSDIKYYLCGIEPVRQVLLKGADLGNVFANLAIREYWIWQGEPDKAFACLRRAAEAGDADAQYCLGAQLEDIQMGASDGTLSYTRIYGGPWDNPAPNFEEALKWLSAAADQGSVEAQIHIARQLMDYGDERPAGYPDYGIRDSERALELLRQGAAKEDPRAIAALADFYEHGLGVPRDLAKARELFLRAQEAPISDELIKDYWRQSIQASIEQVERKIGCEPLK